MQKFKYKKSFRIIYWGCNFDSLLELKYAISVQNDYQFLRAHIPIYYDPKTKRPTNYIREYTKRYTPDFLIRHKKTSEAFLVELKPRAFKNDKQLELRREVAENYIRWRSLDWHYIVIYDDEIWLTAEQQKQFEECCQLKNKSSRKIWFQKLNNRFDHSKPSFFKTVPENSEVHFVMYGSRSLKKLAYPVIPSVPSTDY